MLLGSTRDIAEAFEAAVGRHVPSRPSGAERDGDGRTAELPMLWLHYLHWAAQVDDASGVVSLPQLLRRCLLDFCGAPAGVAGKASVAPAVGSGSDAELHAVLCTEPSKSFFRGCHAHGDAASHVPEGLWEEASTLAAHACLRRLRRARPLSLSKLRPPPALSLLLAAHAVRSGETAHAHSILATVGVID